MAHAVCPWWIGYFLASPIRRLRQDPAAILRGHVRNGMVVLEPGPGMGFFTLELARMVGPTGRVIAVDLQQKMLETLMKRARRAKVADRIETRLVDARGLGVKDLRGKVDFALAFAMVHEVPDPRQFFREVSGCLKAKGRVLFGEPSGHVSDAQFDESLATAKREGLAAVKKLEIAGTRAALLEKTASATTRGPGRRPAPHPRSRRPPRR